MMISPRPCSAFNLRAFARISMTLSAALSAMKIGASERRAMAWASLGQSVSERKPVRSFDPSTSASLASIRCTTCSLLDSRLKMATGVFCCSAARGAELVPGHDGDDPEAQQQVLRLSGDARREHLRVQGEVLALPADLAGGGKQPVQKERQLLPEQHRHPRRGTARRA